MHFLRTAMPKRVREGASLFIDDVADVAGSDEEDDEEGEDEIVRNEISSQLQQKRMNKMLT